MLDFILIFHYKSNKKKVPRKKILICHEFDLTSNSKLAIEFLDSKNLYTEKSIVLLRNSGSHKVSPSARDVRYNDNTIKNQKFARSISGDACVQN